MADEGCTTQLISREGAFNVEGLEHFVKAVRLSECGLSYAVVSIMGPQSSGKSTLLNHLFRTNFREMDALRGRIQTTKGIWIAKCPDIEPCTIVMDLEGTDGRERGEDDTVFEKQSALFALAISDVVLINMWCHDIGREHASNKPLLKIVFQVMLRLFSPRKTTLLFVIRDKTKTPLHCLQPILMEDLQTIWDTVLKTQAQKATPFYEYFNVEVVALPSYEDKEDEFKKQVAQLRQHFLNSTAPGGLAGDRGAVIPASAFSLSAQQFWKTIRENKDLDLPAHKVMVATVRCEEIANEKLDSLTSDKHWLELVEAVRSGPVPGFGKKVSSILDTYFAEYDLEAVYFDEGVRTSKLHQLEHKAMQLVKPVFQLMLGHLRSKALAKFKIDLEQSLRKGMGFAASVRNCTQSNMLEFDQSLTDVVIKQADWGDASKVREKLNRDIEEHASLVRDTKLCALKVYFENQLTKALVEPIESLFDAAEGDTWASIRRLHKSETNKALSGLSTSLSEFELEQETFNKIVTDLKDFSWNLVGKKAREEAGKVLIHMKDRFSTIFCHDKDLLPRVWTGKEDIRLITKDARAAALKLLAVLAAIRLDDKTDNIEKILRSSLLDGKASKERHKTSADPLTSMTWAEIPPKNTLISPVQCKAIWKEFNREIEYIVTQAVSAQGAHRRIANSWLPPPWAIAAIMILGFNEFMMLLRNPAYVFLIFTVMITTASIWQQLDIAQDFRRGTIPGLISLFAKFLPMIMNLLRKLAGMDQSSQNPQRSQSSISQSFSNRIQREALTSYSDADLLSSSAMASCVNTGDE